MEPDDEEDPEPFDRTGSERVWLHPSEMGSLLPPATGRFEGPRSSFVGSTPPSAPGERRSLASLGVPVISGMTGAALAIAVLALAGVLTRPPRDQVIERVADLPVYNLAEPDGIAQVVAAITPAIVGLRATTPSGDRFGSGVVFRSDGHILTNHHLVDGATSIELTGFDGSSWVARHAGSDPESDLAVLTVSGEMEPALLGSTRSLRVGQTAVVVGAPAGPQGSPSVTAGVIAGLGEVVELAGGIPLYDVIATDAMIGARASGGPMVDRNGAVVGIATRAVAEGAADRLGLVIPIDLARRVADQIIATGRIAYPWLGMGGTDLDPWTAKEYGVTKGTLVRQVTAGSPAARAGVAVQDVVVAVEGAQISTMNELMMLVRRHAPGDRINLSVIRSGLKQTLKVQLGEAPRAL